MAGWAVDTSSVTTALAALRKRLPASVSSKFEQLAKTVEEQARTVHRYKRRTGKLQEATVAEEHRLEILGYLDESKAHYGKYVHDGQRSWQPDPFLTNAFNGFEGKMRREAQAAIDLEISRAGLS